MKKGNFFSAKNLTALAILLALVVVLQALGGSFSLGVVTLNFSLVPIVLGAMVLGSFAGAFLGLANGIVVLVQVISGANPFYALIWAEAPVITTLICLLKGTVAGGLAGWVFSILQKKNGYVASFVTAGLVPVVNTALFILGCIAMWDTIAQMAGGQNVFAYVLVGLVTFNFFLEFAVNLLVAPALNTVYGVVEKQFKRKRR